MNNIAEYGRDTLFTITGPNNMAQAGATLGVFLKTKDKSVKELAGPAALSAARRNYRPAIYGVTLRFKRPFFIGAVFSGIAGAIVAAAGTGAPTTSWNKHFDIAGIYRCRICRIFNRVCDRLFWICDCNVFLWI